MSWLGTWEPYKVERIYGRWTHAPALLITMKFVLLFGFIAISSLASVFGTPTSRSLVDGIAVSSEHEFDVEPSVDASPQPASDFKDAAASSIHHWVCITVSLRTGRYGWSQGGSLSAALGGATSKCGGAVHGCGSFYQCQELGCVGIDYGVGKVAISRASGYGRQDGRKAEDKARSICKSQTHGCKKPGHFCANQII